MERADEPGRHFDERAMLPVGQIAKGGGRVEFAMGAVGDAGGAVVQLSHRRAGRRLIC